MGKVIIRECGDVIIRELMDSDLEKMALYANNERVSINLRDGFPKPFTIENARNFKKMVDTQNPKTYFAIEYMNEYVGNISLTPGTDVYRILALKKTRPIKNGGLMTRAQ